MQATADRTDLQRQRRQPRVIDGARTGAPEPVDTGAEVFRYVDAFTIRG
jgi:hypothetical protein